MPASSSTSDEGAPNVTSGAQVAHDPAIDLPQGYPLDLQRDVIDGEMLHYHVRPIRPDDAQRLIAFHHRLSQRSTYLRFFTYHPTLTAAEVERFTCVDYVNRLALVAEIDDAIIAIGRFDRKVGDTEAEVAFVVADEFQHHGIGSLLLDELVKAAWNRGIQAFRSETLAENKTMLDVFRHAGFPISSSVEWGTVTFHFSITPTKEYQMALAQREATRRSPEVTRAPHPGVHPT